MTRDEAEAAVRDILRGIQEHRRRNLLVPHGFDIEGVQVEERRNPFAPDVLRHWRVSAQLSVPVIYTPDSTYVPVRAALPAARDNLDRLQDWIASAAAEADAHMELQEWVVSPDEAPAPYLPSGEPNGSPASWAVTAVIDVG